MAPSLPASRARAVAAATLLAAVLAGALGLAGSARLERADFTFNNAAEVSTLDPATVTGVPEGRVVRALFEGLCVKDPETLAPLPGMAESWEVSEDGRVYTFHVRRGARWTNGDEVTAEDFEWSWERFLHPTTASEYAYQLWYAAGAREYTLLPDDRWYRPGFVHSVWARELPGGRVRVGVSGYGFDGLTDEAPVATEARVGDALEAGDVLVDFPGFHHLHVPLDGRVNAVNEDLASTVGALRLDPYEAGWMLELEPDDGALERAREEGLLVDAATFRSEYAWPRRVGIRATDRYTLRVELENPTPYFLSLVSFYPLFPVNRRNIEEARERWPGSWEIEWKRAENIVTNGPFRIAFRRVNDRIRLVKNRDYWDADHVAFETVDVLAVEHLGTSLNLYLTGEVDWIDRPITNVIPRLLPREDFDPAPYLGSYFYRCNVTEPPFDDPRLRKALALAIDRDDLCTNVTKAGEAPAWGYVPPGMPGYAGAEMEHADGGTPAERHARDVARAKALLAEAGYGPGGRALPTIEIHYNTDQMHEDLAEVIADAWHRHLGLDVKLLNQEWKVYLDTQRTLDYDVSRSAWIGDYPDPNTFLDMFVTGGENNRTGWGNARFDELVRGAAGEADPERRMAMLAEAEAILLDEAPILPIFYYVTRNLVNPRLGGWHANVQDEHFPKFWYWMDDEELAAKRAAQDPDAQLVPARGPAEGLYSPAERRRRARADGARAEGDGR